MDTDRGIVSSLSSRGLDTTHADGIEFLRSQQLSSMSLISITIHQSIIGRETVAHFWTRFRKLSHVEFRSRDGQSPFHSSSS